jgi:hypothetical protein
MEPAGVASGGSKGIGFGKKGLAALQGLEAHALDVGHEVLDAAETVVSMPVERAD